MQTDFDIRKVDFDVMQIDFDMIQTDLTNVNKFRHKAEISSRNENKFRHIMSPYFDRMQTGTDIIIDKEKIDKNYRKI